MDGQSREHVWILLARRHRAGVRGLVAGVIGLIGMTQVAAEQVCRPALAFKDVKFSAMQPPTLKRTWTAIVSVDASGCAANASGQFEIVFTRLSELAPDLEFRQRFRWSPPSVSVAVDFAATEAVQRYRVDNVTPCVCGR